VLAVVARIHRVQPALVLAHRLPVQRLDLLEILELVEAPIPQARQAEAAPHPQIGAYVHDRFAPRIALEVQHPFHEQLPHLLVAEHAERHSVVHADFGAKLLRPPHHLHDDRP
jgi:hypothetical protein